MKTLEVPCTNHRKKSSEGVCVKCGRNFCDECLLEINGVYRCAKCFREKTAEGNFYVHTESQDIYSGLQVPIQDKEEPLQAKTILWMILMVYMPFMGVLVGDRWKPFEKTGNWVSRIIGLFYLVVIGSISFALIAIKIRNKS